MEQMAQKQAVRQCRRHREKQCRRTGKAVDTLYLTILSRYPTADEKQTVAEYFKTTSSKRDVAFDLTWALLNSAEFLYRH